MPLRKVKGKTPACLSCELGCSIKGDLSSIWRGSFLPSKDDPELEKLVRTLFSTLAQIVKDGHITSSQQLGKGLAALFDLCISLEYATLVADTDWLYCPPSENDRNGVLFYPYVRACPRCTTDGKKVETKCSHKPGSDKIGSIAAKTLSTFVQAFRSYTGREWQVRQTRRQAYEVDVVLFNQRTLALCEVKASPLIAFPLAVKLAQPLEITDSNGQNQNSLTHYEPANITSDSEILMYVPKTPTEFFQLGKRANRTDFLKSFRQRYAKDRSAVLSIIKSWEMFFDGYRDGWNSSNELKWLTFGCGGGVDDSKNLPGIDRTDDIKKGIYQVISMGQRFAKKCIKRSIKVVLFSNMHAVRHHKEYLHGLQDIIWTYEAQLQPAEDAEWRKVRLGDLVKLYDAVITFTESHFRDPELKRSFSLDALFASLGGKQWSANP